MALQPITVNELAQKILANEDVFLLDIRKEEDYNDWSIQGRNVTSMNNPFKQLENETEDVKNNFQKIKQSMSCVLKGFPLKKEWKSWKRQEYRILPIWKAE